MFGHRFRKSVRFSPVLLACGYHLYIYSINIYIHESGMRVLDPAVSGLRAVRFVDLFSV